ncbi:TPA: HAD-IIIC family phosphatase [Escherichia coli]|mgnify:CR=1 FL=1|uniref:HAD-IIIC family phosphatase n=1 Tax=Escherichia coli TaxID=562 RepID=UPI000C048928|nr:HAD-IIIC family phosphatase [Escherichia coli]MJD64555.1 HAD-IIIC family phosphatase [Shigella dysenteriae]EFG4026664.1 HAD-IIIC family phosphatase [Escherichia coli]EFJ1427913.1 HAD-IIIC family phosphatase [Escherichia coli]EFN0938994.1 HAD-IIIC family phosphatase [Escherichia coli]EHM8599793.1 HAD-IIIC family phosphatase [Escherichia coli]
MNHTYDLQNFIFESNPGRQDLFSYKKTNHGDKFKVYIYRNHSFEMIEKSISAYLDYAELDIQFLYSDYDDSLSFFELDTEADLVIIWLDLSRYSSDVNTFIMQRIEVLKNIYRKNILFCYYVCNNEIEITITDPQITIYNISKWREEFGDKYEDLRLEKFSGSKMSMPLMLAVSRDLGLNYLPSLLRPSIKCIALDLDNTLYRGVLGEDGVDGIELTDAHVKLQKRVSELALNGFFICVVSKNDQRDVDFLLQNRDDFFINSKNVIISKASWNPKAEAISEIAAQLNIGVDSILFIDDNIGELLSVKQVHPSIKTILAKDNALVTLEILNNFPGLLKLGQTNEDSLRNIDSKANEERQKILDTMTKEDFIKQMNIQLDFMIEPRDEIYRISELSNKTNQFIFNYKRYSTAEIENIINDKESVVVAVSVKDKLANSGIVGGVVLRKNENDECAVLEECFVSCRALGRGIDDIIVLGAISVGLKRLGTTVLSASYVEGERNLPAKFFFDSRLSKYLTPSVFKYTIPTELVQISIKE